MPVCLPWKSECLVDRIRAVFIAPAPWLTVLPTVLLEHGQLPDLDSQPELLFHFPQRGMEQQEPSLTKSPLQKHLVNVCCVPGLVRHWEDRGE